MARAMKCDVCGSCYEPYNEENSSFPNAISFVSVDARSHMMNIDKYDLCPTCLTAIGMYIHDLKFPNGAITHEILQKEFNLPVDDVEGEYDD